MEFIPTIVTALEIAAVLTIISLIVSYIAHRLKENDTESDAIVRTEGHTKIASLPPEKKDKNLQLKNTRSSFDKPLFGDEQIKRAENKKEIKPESLKKHETPVKKEQPFKNRRLEILDNLGNADHLPNLPVSEKPAEKKTRPANLSSLGDDILGKYENDETDKMFSLKAADKKDKKNDL